MLPKHGMLRSAVAICLMVVAMATAANEIAIVGVTIIDVSNAGRSTQDLNDATIIIRDGLIVQVGRRSQIALPLGAQVIDGAGSYVVPGLIDGFGSLRTQGFADAYLYEGVTTVYVNQAPAGSDGEQLVATIKGGPRLLRGATIGGYLPDGALLQTRPWIDNPAHDGRLSNVVLVREVETLADRGMRGIMIGLDVWPDQFDEIIAAAKRRRLATVGEFAFTSYPHAIYNGIRTLVRNDHYLTALAPPEALAAYAREPMGKAAGAAYRAVCQMTPDAPQVVALGTTLVRANTALMPILSIEATADDVGAPNPWLSRSSVFVNQADLDVPVDPISGARPYLDAHPDRREALQACARRRQEVDGQLHQMGITYLAGSGAPGYGIMPGGGLHQELRLLQQIGLTPREALAAATDNFAEVYGWDDIGRIAIGRAGDVLLLGSDPRTDIAALEDIRVVVHDGQVVDRLLLLSRATTRSRSQHAKE